MEIERQRGKYVANCGFVNETDVEEILALIGLLYMTGCRKDNHLTTAEMWSKHGPEVYRCVMSETRFRFLISYLRFDDKTMRDREDKLSPVQYLGPLTWYAATPTRTGKHGTLKPLSSLYQENLHAIFSTEMVAVFDADRILSKQWPKITISMPMSKGTHMNGDSVGKYKSEDTSVVR
ncbi:unnamed protein product [Acanthoscelides obtectus]|uniref:PiggyBac transposable element-derived protein domain-containing protein n=1 Tax=Acanthoscelides obtectus TaxID=200917 RepID=A0A9P0NVX1_ACAOB|nr:unnamed protein product [Acanthoscelides obtectus]CAK1658110.1 hypothetical protein AOBTE_LOCUS20695 [Acanthoscelides obtectus]